MILNFVAAFVGWFTFNAIMASIAKDAEFDKPEILTWSALFQWANQYTIRSVDNWVASLGAVPILLFFGHKGLAIPNFGIGTLTWTDAYYPCAGIFTEVIISIYKKWKTSK